MRSSSNRRLQGEWPPFSLPKRRATGKDQTPRRDTEDLARENPGTGCQWLIDCPGHPIWPQPLGWAGFLDDGRIEIDSKYRRAQRATDCSEQKECSVRRRRRRGGKLGDARLAG